MDCNILSIDQEIHATLNDWKVCWICQIRLLNRNFDFEMLKDYHISEEWICYLCCSILQHQGRSLVNTDKIVSTIKDSKFLFNSFEMTISTPTNLLIREFAVWHSLKTLYKERFKDMSMDDMTTVKSIWKWSVKNQVSENLGKEYLNGNVAKETRIVNNSAVENDILSVAITFNHDKFESECSVLGEIEPNLIQRRRRGEKRYHWEVFTRKTIIQVLQRTTIDTLSRYYRLPPNHICESSEATLSVIVSRQDSIIIGGRYCKYSRRLPQSPWIFDGVRKLEGSIEEFITESLIKASLAESSIFVSSGREDVDVRMLGNGRPFVVELRNCKNMSVNIAEGLSQLESEITAASEGKLCIKNLSLVSRDSVNMIKKGEEEKSKKYRAVIYCDNGLSSDNRELSLINGTKDLQTMQWTPIRVLHRRSLIERPRTFYSLSAVRLDSALSDETLCADESLADYRRFLDMYDPNHLFVLHLRCQAGSYIKEFVHGDLGRTSPNLGTIIGQGCDILALDVMEIELDWPPVMAVARP